MHRFNFLLRYDKAEAKLPFQCLSDSTLLGQGAHSTVHQITATVVLKTPHSYTVKSDGPKRLLQQIEESEAALEDEKAWYEELDRSPHPNRLQSLMITKEGIFLPKILSVLKDFITTGPVDAIQKYRWALEIASAALSLEVLGLAHCDIASRNIFIDHDGHAKLGDFDGMTRHGQLPTLHPPHFIWYDTSTSAQHDLFRIGEVLWEIFTGHEYDWGFPETPNPIPDTSKVECGEMIDRCWRQLYTSIAQLKSDLEVRILAIRYGSLAALVDRFPRKYVLWGFDTARVMTEVQLAATRREIEAFLARESGSPSCNAIDASNVS